jgi:hypothetical protein
VWYEWCDASHKNGSATSLNGRAIKENGGGTDGTGNLKMYVKYKDTGSVKLQWNLQYD